MKRPRVGCQGGQNVRFDAPAPLHRAAILPDSEPAIATCADRVRLGRNQPILTYPPDVW